MVREQVQKAKEAQALLAESTVEQRNSLLLAFADGLQRDAESIFSANKIDLENNTNLPQSVYKRLNYNEEKLRSNILELKQVVALPNPVGKVLERRLLDNDFLLEKVTSPIGVVSMIFEARPDALAQIVSLCLKSGNAIILKGGKEALNTNEAIYQSLVKTASQSPLGSDWMVLAHSREDVNELLTMDDLIDLVVPRGSYAFVKHVKANTSIPVLGHSDGLCSIFIDSSANIDKAVTCVIDSKINYPAACNAVETLLVHKDIASSFLPAFYVAAKEKNIVIHGDPATSAIISCIAATNEDFDTEYLSLEIAVKIVSSLEEAVHHIGAHGSHHTDSILTENKDSAVYFLNHVDSADVFVNCSTRFSDGFRYGLGAELGISTSRIHARGPVGVSGLLTTRWLLAGNGQIVDSYMGKNAKAFIHKELPTTGLSLLQTGGFDK